MIRIATISVLTLAISTGAALVQDVSAGETSFQKCQPCHDVGENAKSKLGPPLNGLDGRKAGTTPSSSTACRPMPIFPTRWSRRSPTFATAKFPRASKEFPVGSTRAREFCSTSSRTATI